MFKHGSWGDKKGSSRGGLGTVGSGWGSTISKKPSGNPKAEKSKTEPEETKPRGSGGNPTFCYVSTRNIPKTFVLDSPKDQEYVLLPFYKLYQLALTKLTNKGNVIVCPSNP